jgi:heme-degrading monooxygenase HmoA
MVARIWHGIVPVAKSEAYLDLMLTVGVQDYKSVAGNRGAYVFHRIAEDVAHFTMLSFWDSLEDIKEFAGEDVELAKYYDFDRLFLLEMEPRVLHYEAFESLERQESYED